MKHCYVLVLLIAVCFSGALFAQNADAKMVGQTSIEVENWYSVPANHIYVDPSSGKVHISYTYSGLEFQADTTDMEDMSARYATSTDGGATWAHSDVRGVSGNTRYGNPGIGMLNNGSMVMQACVGGQGWFYVGAWTYGVALWIETGVGTATFDSLYFFDGAPGSNDANFNLSGYVLTDPNGVIHMATYDGFGLNINYKRSEDGGFTFGPTIAIGDNVTEQNIGDQTFYCEGILANAGTANNVAGFGFATNGDNVAIAVPDEGGNVYLIESFDGGATFNGATDTTASIIVANPPVDTLAGNPGERRPNRNADAIYDADGNLHVVYEAVYYLSGQPWFERFPWFGEGSGDMPYPAAYKPALHHWSAATGETVIAVSPWPNSDLDSSYTHIGVRRPTSLMHMPTFAYDADNDHLYVVYNQFSENWGTWYDSTNSGFTYPHFLGHGEIYATASTDGGATWSKPDNLTNTPNFGESDPVVNNEVVNGQLHIYYRGDADAGLQFNNGSTNGSAAYYHAADVNPILSIGDLNPIAKEFELEQNYPNPFNPTTSIKYTVSSLSDVQLNIYNVLGQKIKTLVNSAVQPGTHVAQWDGTNDDGFAVTSGVYIYEISGDFGKQSKKMVLMR